MKTSIAMTTWYPVEVLRSLDAPGLPPGELCVKIGCPLILLVNLAPSRGLCYGTQMVLRRVSHHVLEVLIIGGSHSGSIALISRVSLTPNSDGSDFPFVLRRCQFPVCLAFAMSINKSQGQSLKVVGLDFESQCSLMASFMLPFPTQHLVAVFKPFCHQIQREKLRT